MFLLSLLSNLNIVYCKARHCRVYLSSQSGNVQMRIGTRLEQMFIKHGGRLVLFPLIFPLFFFISPFCFLLAQVALFNT